MLLRWLAAMLLTMAAVAPARALEPASPVQARAAELPDLLNGRSAPARLFSPAFLAKVPAAQVEAVARQLRESHGKALGVQRVEAGSATEATIFVDYERAIVRMELAVAPAAPHLIEGLLVAGAETKGDSVTTIFGELTALPGQVSINAARLEDSGPANFLTQGADKPLAIGSAFKLFVLAELARSVSAGERKWSDVVPLGTHSIPSGLLQDWPADAPMTLHSLATLMISISDNSASDTLLAVLGREKVERHMAEIGVRAPELNRPLLSTRELFALKTGDPALISRWRTADEATRRTIVAEQLATIAAGSIPIARLGGKPIEIAAIEWFASTADLVRVMDWLRRKGGRETLDILAVNPGLGKPAAAPFQYFGYKGGSEPGVINMSFLLRNREGRWIALAVTWNDSAAPVDEARFAALVTRLVALMR